MSIDILNEIWPEWKIQEQLGRGSYGVVYKAVKNTHNLESFSAIKVISVPDNMSEIENLRAEGLSEDDTKKYLKGIVDEFTSEIQLMESLKGTQNIVNVEDFKIVEKKDSIGFDIFIRMELLTPLNTYISDKTLTEQDVAHIGYDICNALEICNQRNVIHRDVKPENIFVNDFGYFKLGDFGIARKLENMTYGLSQKGTYNYMAPEVSTSSNYDARVDIYSLGIVLYRLMNQNRLPFLNDDSQLINVTARRNAVDRRMRGEKLEPPSNASKEFSAIILRACEYDPNLRYNNATEMKIALKNIADGNYSNNSDDYDDLDKTVSVRKSKNDLDATTAIRKSPNSNQVNENKVDTFGNTQDNKFDLKKIGLIAVIVLCFSSVTVFAFPKILDKINQTDNNEGIIYSEFDKQEIKKAIENADELYNQGDRQGAIDIINENLLIYPDSNELLDKYEQYTNNEEIPAINITLNPVSDVQFPDVNEGYSSITDQTIAIRNDGTSDTGVLTISLIGRDASQFEISTTSISNIQSGQSDSFTVKPKTGLSYGTYQAEVKVSGFGNVEKVVGLLFVVNQKVVTTTTETKKITTNPSVSLDSFYIDSNTYADYSNNLDTSTYAKYNSGISDFNFAYPTKLYNSVYIDTDMYNGEFGENMQTIVFSGTDGSELTYRIFRRTDGQTIKTMTNNVLTSSKNSLYDESVIINSTVSDRGRVIVTGWDDSQHTYCYYNMVKIEGDYILQMLVKYPAYYENEDKNHKFYVTECLYNLCGFSNTDKKLRTYKEYMEESGN